MSKKKFTLSLSAFMIIVLTACNLPGGASTQVPELALTVTAQALLLQQAGSPAPAGQETTTPQFTATPQFTSTAEFTPTPSVPMVTVSQATNCRTGPSTQYDLISALLIGETAEVVGKNTATNYWIIKTPGDPNSTCWLWGEYATVTGNVAALPEIAIPATPTPSPTPTLAPPAPIKNLKANKICIPLVLPNYQYGGNITWEDKSDNEKGFNIYLNGALLNVAPANTTSYPIPPLVFPLGTPLTLGVEAFNDAGKATIKDIIVVCP